MTDSKPKLVFVCGYPFAENEHTILWNFGRMLKDDFDLVVISSAHQIPRRLEEYFQIVEINRWLFAASNILGYFAALLKAVAMKPSVIINTCKPNRLGAVVSLMGAAFSVPTVIRVTGDVIVPQPIEKKSIFSRSKRWFRRNFIRFYLQRATRIICVSHRLATVLSNLNVPMGRISVMLQPFDGSKFTASSGASRASARRSLGLNRHDKTLLVVGSLTYSKGADRLINLLRKLTHSGEPSLCVCIVGKGEAMAELQVLEEEGAPVQIFGHVSHEAIAAFFMGSDLFGFFSRSEGGIPNVVLEAVAAGLPVISYPVADVPNVASRVVENIEEFFAATKELATSGQETEAARPVMDIPTWQVQSEQYIRFFSKVAGG